MKRARTAFEALVAVALVINLSWQVYAAAQTRRRADFVYFVRAFEDHGRAATNDTFLISAGLLEELSKLPESLPGNFVTDPKAEYIKVGFLQSEGADKFWEQWPANRWGLYDRTFGALEVNLDAYPTFVGNQRVLVTSRERLRDLPVTGEYLTTPELSVSKAEVVAGKDFYFLKIKDRPNSKVVIRYSFDGAPPGEFEETLKEEGEVRIEVGPEARKGVYRILAYRGASEQIWHNVDTSVTVR